MARRAPGKACKAVVAFGAVAGHRVRAFRPPPRAAIVFSGCAGHREEGNLHQRISSAMRRHFKKKLWKASFKLAQASTVLL